MTTVPSDMALLQAMHIYFQGEKIEALVFILPMGLLSLVFGAWLITDSGSSFKYGVAMPFLVLGLLMTIVGGVVGLRTPAQVQSLEQALQADKPVALKTELERMDKVNRAWPIYLSIWCLLGVTGLVLRFATRSDLLQGLSIALVFFCGLGLMVDGFAERRTHPYVSALKAQL